MLTGKGYHNDPFPCFVQDRGGKRLLPNEIMGKI